MLKSLHIALQPLIKWPGGKSRLLSNLKHLFPANFNRYIEPFVGGGAVFFYLNHTPSIINDINRNLITFYRLIQDNNQQFFRILENIAESWDNLDNRMPIEHELIRKMGYAKLKNMEQDVLWHIINDIVDQYRRNFPALFVNNWNLFKRNITNSLIGKIKALSTRLEKLIRANKQINFDYEIEEQIKTAKRAGFYYFFRDIVNNIDLRNENLELYIAAYVFVREFCFGSMFRYNKDGEFNIPYGGKAYNKKNFTKKVKYYFSPHVRDLLQNTEIYNEDFEMFLERINVHRNDFIFIDPPYISEFNEYEKVQFDISDHNRLSNILRRLKCSYVLIVEKNECTLDIYSNLPGRYLEIESRYLYSARGRNNRDVVYLVIANVH